MDVTTIHPQQSQTQEDDELAVDEDAPPAPRQQLPSRSMHKQRRGNNHHHQNIDEDIPVPQLPPPHADLDDHDPPRLKEAYPFLDFNGAPLALPSMALRDDNLPSSSLNPHHFSATQPSHSSSSFTSSRQRPRSLGPSVEVDSTMHTTSDTYNTSTNRSHSRQYESQPVSGTGGLSTLLSMANSSRPAASQKQVLQRQSITRSSSPQSEASADNSREIEELQQSLTRPAPSISIQNKAVPAAARQKLSDIAGLESQPSEGPNISDEEDRPEENFELETETQKHLEKSQGHSQSRPSLPSSQLHFIEGVNMRPVNHGRSGYSTSTVAAFSQASSRLPPSDKSPTARTITAPKSKKTANRFPHQKDRVDSDTAESSEDEDDDDEENDRTRVYQNGRNRSSDVDATRVEHSAYQDQDPSFETDQGGKVTSSRRGKASERNLFSNGITYDVRGVEVFKVPSRPMARRQGKPVKESRMAEPQESNGTVEEVDEDDDELPPPLTSSAKTSSNREKSNGLLRTRAATIQITVTTRRSGRTSNASTHDVAPRRSGRSSIHATVPKLKVGDVYPLKYYKKLLDSAKSFIEQGEHVANLTLAEMYLNEDNNFEETQKAEARLEKDPEAAVRTWQMFIYCRNRKIGIKSLSSKKALNREPSSPHSNGRGSNAIAGPSKSRNNAGSRVSGSSNDLPSPSSSNTSNNVPAEADLPFPPLEMPPDDIYRHAKDGNCPGQISAYIEIDPHTYGRSFWKIDQVTNHCLECMTMDMDIGKGMEDQIEARKEYFAYWSGHWDNQVKAVLKKTQNFMKQPTLPKRVLQALPNHQARAENRQDDGEPFLGNGFNFDDDDGDAAANGQGVDDENGESGAQSIPPSSPARRKSKRKAQAPRIFHVDDHEIDGRNSPELYGETPSPAKKARFAPSDVGTSSANAKRRRSQSAPGPSQAQAAKGKGRAERTTQPAAPRRSQDEYDLGPDTLLVDLNLPASVDKLLEELSIRTLADLRSALKGDDGFFRDGTDVPVEDFLSFMETKVHHYARGNIGFQYDFNRRNGPDNTIGDDGDEQDLEDLQEREKKEFVNNCVTILKAGRVLTRALRAVKW